MISQLNQFGIHQPEFRNIHIMVKQHIYSVVIVVINSILFMMDHAIVFVLHRVDLQVEVMGNVPTLMKSQNSWEKFGEIHDHVNNKWLGIKITSLYNSFI
jgi:hypothetical protein